MEEKKHFKSIKSKERLVDRVVRELESMILTGKLTPGTKLSAEREIAEQLGVSRNALREAIRILATKGLLHTKHGVGTIVRQITSEQVTEPLNLLLNIKNGNKDIYQYLHQARSILEIEIAGLAAEQTTEQDLVRLRQIFHTMELHADNSEILAKMDADLHATLVKMTCNPLLEILTESIRSLMNEYIEKVTVCLDPQTEIIPQHRALTNAICSRDPLLARKAMREHQIQMKKNYEKWLKQQDADKS